MSYVSPEKLGKFKELQDIYNDGIYLKKVDGQTKIDDLATIRSNAEAGAAAKGLVDTLVGTDASKSVRTIAGEVTSAAVGTIPAKVDQTTTSTVVAYVDAKDAQLDARLDVLEGPATTAGSVAEAKKAADDAKAAADAAAELIGGSGAGSVETQITAKIEALDATVGSTTVAQNKHVAVQVVEADGKLTGVTVTENDIASAQGLSDLQAVVGISKLGTGESSIDERLDVLEGPATTAGSVAEAKKAADDAKAAADAAAALISGTGAGSVDTKITAKIEALDATVGSTTVAEGKHVAVQVVEADGKLTGVTVTESDIASKSVQDKLVALHAVKSGTGADAVYKTVAEEIATVVNGAPAAYDTLLEIANWIDNNADKDNQGFDAAARIVTLENNVTTLQGNNAVECEESDITALFDSLDI